MIILQAPYPALQTTSLLPNPQFGDSEAPQQSMNIRRAMDGTRRTYVKTNQLSKLHYEFMLLRPKALEVRAFIESYYYAEILLTNHKNEVWLVHFATVPFELTDDQRITIVLEFEGTKLSG
jgi:hypothetical protein